MTKTKKTALGLGIALLVLGGLSVGIYNAQKSDVAFGITPAKTCPAGSFFSAITTGGTITCTASVGGATTTINSVNGPSFTIATSGPVTLNTSGTIFTIGSTALTASTANGLYLQITNNLSDVSNSSTALSNLAAVGASGNVLTSNGTAWASQAPAQNGTLDYFMSASSSDVASNNQLNNAPYPTSASTTVASISNGTTSIQSFTTKAGEPGTAFISPGIIDVRISAAQTAGTKPTQLYAVVNEVSATGTFIGTIATTPSSSVLTGAITGYDLLVVLSNPYTFASTTSRVQVNVIAQVSGALLAPTVNLNYGGTYSNSRLDLPAQSVDASSYVPYGGATQAVNLGTQNLTTGGYVLAAPFYELNTETSETGTTTATMVTSTTIPANTLGPNGSMYVYLVASTTNTATTEIFQLSFGGTTFCSTSLSAVTSWQGFCRITNRNATNVQVSPASWTTSANAASNKNGAIDTTANQTLGIQVTAGQTTSTNAIETWYVIVTK